MERYDNSDFGENPDLPRDTRVSLWEQGVNMDDWNYILFLPDSEAAGFYGNLSELLTGPCDNVWHRVRNFNGRPGLLGIAYHA